MKLYLQHHLRTVREMQRCLGSKLRKVSRCGRKALTPIKHTPNLPSSSNEKNWYIWEKEAHTGMTAISPSEQVISLSYYCMNAIHTRFQDPTPMRNSFLKGGISCIGVIRQLHYRATTDLSKIFFQFKVYCNGQFMFCWERSDLLHTITMNQTDCEAKNTTYPFSWFITLNPFRHKTPEKNKTNTAQANRRNKTMKISSNTLEIFFSRMFLFCFLVVMWRNKFTFRSQHND